MILLFSVLMMLKCSEAASQLYFRVQLDTVENKFSLRVMPQNFYTHPSAFFCKKEVQLQQALRLPVFIRLGTKDYVDFLERKNTVGRRNMELGIKN